jgi:hypothetical protein
LQRQMTMVSDFGEEDISTEPAIYLWLHGQHAMFSEHRPTDKLIILAIQLERRQRDVRDVRDVRAVRPASAVSVQ